MYDVEDYLSQKEEEQPRRGKGHCLPTHLFINMDPEEVDEIPAETDGKNYTRLELQ